MLIAESVLQIIKLLISLFISGSYNVQAVVVLNTTFYNTTVMKNGHIEWVIQEYQPLNSSLLLCSVKSNLTSSNTLILAKLINGKMQTNTDSNLQPWGLNGRVSIKDNFTIVITNITFREQGFVFECELQYDFYIVQKRHIIQLVLGKLVLS